MGSERNSIDIFIFTLVTSNVRLLYRYFLKELILEHLNETNSKVSKLIIDNFDEEVKNFIQICPKEMIDKIENPITLKSNVKDVS